MSYKLCPHYDEMVTVLAEGEDIEDITFEITETDGCRCSDCDGEICSLWFSLTWVGQLEPQMGIQKAKLTIETLQDRESQIAFDLIRNLGKSAEQSDD